MQKPEFDTIQLPDGYQAHARWWRSGPSRGAVLYLHGIQSHGGWYEMSGGRLADEGLTVLMPDRRGSGLNQADRGHFESVEQCRSDTQATLDHLLDETGHDQAHVVGVSWGGKQAVALAADQPDRVRSLTLIAPGLFPVIDLNTSEKFQVAMAMVNDRHRYFDIPLNDPSFFTANPDWIRFVENDPLMLRQVSASFLLVTRRLDRVVKRFDRSGFSGTIHLMLAGHDRIIHNDRTRAWVRDLPLDDVCVTEYPEAHHTLEFETAPEPFLADQVHWISARCSAPAEARVG